MEQTKFTYFPLGKHLKNKWKNIEDQGIKQVKALMTLKPEENLELESIQELFPKMMRTHEIKK